jgi:hypothetical protein
MLALHLNMKQAISLKHIAEGSGKKTTFIATVSESMNKAARNYW